MKNQVPVHPAINRQSPYQTNDHDRAHNGLSSHDRSSFVIGNHSKLIKESNRQSPSATSNRKQLQNGTRVVLGPPYRLGYGDRFPYSPFDLSKSLPLMKVDSSPHDTSISRTTESNSRPKSASSLRLLEDEQRTNRNFRPKSALSPAFYSPGRVDLSGISKCVSDRSSSQPVENGTQNRKLSDSELSISSFSFSSANQETLSITENEDRLSGKDIKEKERTLSLNHSQESRNSSRNGIIDNDRVTERLVEDDSLKEIERTLLLLEDVHQKPIAFNDSQRILDRANRVLTRVMLSNSLNGSRSKNASKTKDFVDDNGPWIKDSSRELTRVTDISIQSNDSEYHQNSDVKDHINGFLTAGHVFDDQFTSRFHSTPKNPDHHSRVNRTENSLAWSTSYVPHLAMEQVAIDFYQNQVAKKILRIWCSAFRNRKIQADKVIRKRNCRRMAKAWVKWTTQLQRKRKERMRSVFIQWKEIHLQMKRDVLYAGSSERREMKREYYEWKFQYDVEQGNGIASFHFKLLLLTRCMQVWKMHIAERRAKQTMNNLARVRYEVRLTNKTFLHWKESIGKSCFVKRQMNKGLLLRIFNGWRKWTQYSRMLHKRHLSACKEYRGRVLMRETLDKWRKKLFLKLAIKHHSKAMQRRAFDVWRLQCRRIILRRQMAVAHSYMVLQGKCFIPWMQSAQERLERRKTFVNIVMKIQMKSMFLKWKEFTGKSINLNQSQSSLMELQSLKVLQNAFSKWKHSYDVIRFKEKIADDRIRRLVRNAAMRWKNKIVKKRLKQKLVAASPFFEFLRLKALFKQWVREKQRADRDVQRGKVVATLINKSCVSRIFNAWRIVTQEDRIIHHMVARRERRSLARIFDAWRLVVTRNMVSLKYRKLKEMEKARNIFSRWRETHSLILKERQTKQMFERNLLAKIISRWKDFVTEVKSYRKELSRCYFLSWQTKAQARMEKRERLKAIEASRHIKLKTGLRTWIQKADQMQRKREENERKARELYAMKTRKNALKRWRRQFHVHCIVSEYKEEKRFECLDNAFRQWKDYVKQQLQDAVGRFTDRLERDSPRSVRNHTFSESYASVDMPLLRSSSGYFGSLPNVAKIGSSLPISPLATQRSLIGRDSPASFSPEHPYDRSPKSPVNNFHRSNTFSSPPDRGRASSLERPRSSHERSKSPNSIPSSGSLPNRNKSPFMVPPLFTNSFKDENDDDEVYTELVRPSSLPQLRANDASSNSNSFTQRDKSFDEDSPGSIYGPNMDEDAMSYYSFQSESIGINREHFMSGAIRHWRHLPLSKTFRAWFKYTQERKIRRELLIHFMDCKHVWTTRKIFHSWHRKLYCRLAAEKFFRVKTLAKYLKAIHTHMKQEKAKKEHNLVAELHLRNTRLESAFRLWKRKFSVKRRLHSLVGRWQEAVHISDNDKSKSDEFNKRRKLNMLKEAFQTWKIATEKYEAAKELCTTLFVRRIIKSWKKAASKEKLLRKNHEEIVKIRTAKYLSVWMTSFQSMKKARSHYQNSEAHKFHNVFISWREWTKEEKKLSDQVIKFQKRKNFKLIAQAFFIWSEEAERCKIADDHYKETLLIRIIESWHEYTEQRIDLVIRLEDYQQSSIRTKTRNVFDWWKRSAICSRVFKEKNQIQNRQLQKESFSRWRNNVRQEKAAKHLTSMLLKKSFHSWVKKCVRINKQRITVVTVAKRWLSKTRAHLDLEARAKVFSEGREKDLVQKSFIEWREAAHGLKVARLHYEYRLASMTIQTWSKNTRQKNRLRSIRSSVEEVVQFNCISAAFYTWISIYHRVRKNEMVLENYLELKQQEVLKLCMENFRINALKRRAEKHTRYRLQRMVFNRWTNTAYQCKTIAVIRKRLLRITVLKFARKWRERAKELATLQNKADDQIKKRNAILLKKRFQSWTLKTKGRSLARMCFQGHLLKSSFKRWQRSTQRKVLLKGTLSSYTQQREADELRRQFQKWKYMTIQSQKSKKIAEVHEQIAGAHFRKSLLEKCFFSWRNECLVERMLRKKNLKICAEYFAIWKNDCLGANKAENAYDRMLMERTWKQWRKLKIKSDVMKAMERHESTKQLSEVFSAWHNYAFVRRRAWQEYQLWKKRKIFRHWMQEYNKS